MKLKTKTPIFKNDEIIKYETSILNIDYAWSNSQESYVFTITNMKDKQEETCQFDAFLNRIRSCQSEIIFETKKEKTDFLFELKRLWRQEEFLLKLYNYFIYRFEPGAMG